MLEGSSRRLLATSSYVAVVVVVVVVAVVVDGMCASDKDDAEAIGSLYP